MYEEIREILGRLRLGGERREVLGRLTVVLERMEEHVCVSEVLNTARRVPQSSSSLPPVEMGAQVLGELEADFQTSDSEVEEASLSPHGVPLRRAVAEEVLVALRRPMHQNHTTNVRGIAV